MIPRSFEYFAPATLGRALSLLDKYKDEAKILAGGQSLVPLMKLRLASPKYIVDINKLPNLSYIKEVNGSIAIGPLTPHRVIETSDLIRANCPILADAASVIADPLVRNRGTIGGSLTHADPAADYPPAVLALGAQLTIRGKGGQRAVNAQDFFIDYFTTVVQSNELLTEIRVPATRPPTGGAYLKLCRRSGDFAIVGAAAMVTLEGDACKEVSISLGGVGTKAVKAAAAEAQLRGRAAEEGVIREAAEKAAEQLQPTSDIHASAEYRREMAKVFTRRALIAAVNRAKGGGSG